ncbi:MAG: YggS family pyridoxal phosphate-dependent enzyme [Bacteroides sp.]|nr:YggS family pyridoxal phosphate-dependent enzyme [Bacteroides sp.]
MNMIAEEIRRLHALLPEGVRLVAVSKFHPVEKLREAYGAGQRLFGESRVQELLTKIPEMPDDVEWHFIGHLQTNKVRQIIGRTSLIESVDSERLLELIDKESEKAGVVTRVLLEVHVAREETKTGFSPEELLAYFNERRFESLKATHICGLMGMASNVDDEEIVRSDFARISSLFRSIRDDESLGLRGFDILSMGMSGDWETAVAEGSNLVRIGTAIFGSR